MALTRITKGVIKPNENYDTHNINSTGIVTAIGLDVNGNGDISGNLNIGGVLTYEDVTSIDSVGIITAQQGIHVGAGVSAVGVGTFGGLDISGDIDVDGHTNLDNVSVAGVTTFSEGLFIPDDKKLEIGNAAGNGDLQLFYDSTPGESLISHTGPGVLKIEGNSSNNIFIRPKSGENSITAKPDAEVELFYNGIQRFETTSQGIDVTGHSELDNVNIAGVSTFAGNVDINADLDVDGHTNLDNVSIAGIVTATEYRGGGSTGIKVTSAGKVLIGTSTQGSTSADELTIEGSGIMGLSLRSDDSTTGESNVLFADGTSGTDRYTGGIQYQHQHDRFRINVNGGQLAVQINKDKSVNTYAGLSVSGIVTATGGDINGDLDVSGTVSATTFSGGLPITSGADNRVITASSASAIQGEANLTFNGFGLGINDTSGNARLIVSGNSDNGDQHCQIRIYDTDTTAGSRIPSLSFWGSVEQGRIRGTDTNGMRFYTHDGNSLTEKFNIGSDGKVGINQGSPTGMIQVDATSYPETTEYLAVFKAGVANGNRFKNRYIKIRNNYTGSVHGGVPIVWESNADNSNNKAYGAVVTEGNGDIRFFNAGATSEKAIGTDLLSTISEKLRITKDGEVGISPGGVTPTAGDLATGDSQNTPLLHVNGGGGSDTSGEYNLLARFNAGNDADGSGAMIVLNHDNDRGLALIGGRGTDNKSFGAIKSIDNQGRLTDLMAFGGANGQGVEYLKFYTGNSTTTTERLQITSDGKTTYNTTGQVAAEFNTSHSSAAYHDYKLGASGARIGYIGAGSQLVTTSGNTDFAIRTENNFVIGTNGNNERLRISPDGEVRIATRNSSNGGEVGFRFGSFGIRSQDAGGYNWWRIDRNYGGWQSDMISLRADGLIGINQDKPQARLHIKSDDAPDVGANEGSVSGSTLCLEGGQRSTISGSNYLDTALLHLKGQITDSDTNSSGTHVTSRIVFSGRRATGAQSYIEGRTDWVYNTQTAASSLYFLTTASSSNGGGTPAVAMSIGGNGNVDVVNVLTLSGLAGAERVSSDSNSKSYGHWRGNAIGGNYSQNGDNRSPKPHDFKRGRGMSCFFTQKNGNGSGNYMDGMHFSTYSDWSGGSPNLFMINKSNNNVRVIRGAWDSSHDMDDQTYNNYSIYDLDYTSGSDLRLKEDINTIANNTALSLVTQLRPVTFKWKDEYINSGFSKNEKENEFTEEEPLTAGGPKRQVRKPLSSADKVVNVGLIAQEVESVIPTVVHDGHVGLNAEDGANYKNIDYDKIVPYLIGAIKELKSENDVLKKRLDDAGL